MRWSSKGQNERGFRLVWCLELREVKDLVDGYEELVLSSLLGIDGRETNIDFSTAEVKNHPYSAARSSPLGRFDEHSVRSNKHPKVNGIRPELLQGVSKYVVHDDGRTYSCLWISHLFIDRTLLGECLFLSPVKLNTDGPCPTIFKIQSVSR